MQDKPRASKWRLNKWRLNKESRNCSYGHSALLLDQSAHLLRTSKSREDLHLLHSCKVPKRVGASSGERQKFPFLRARLSKGEDDWTTQRLNRVSIELSSPGKRRANYPARSHQELVEAHSELVSEYQMLVGQRLEGGLSPEASARLREVEAELDDLEQKQEPASRQLNIYATANRRLRELNEIIERLKEFA